MSNDGKPWVWVCPICKCTVLGRDCAYCFDNAYWENAQRRARERQIERMQRRLGLDIATPKCK